MPKPDGKGGRTLRTCVDYRKLNDITIKNRYPLPNIQELRDRLNGARWFTKLDQRDAYYLIRMKEGEEWKTAFRTRYGLFEYLVMPFGLTNAPASEQELMNDLFRDILDDYVITYLDDTLVYSGGTLEDHQGKVKEVLSRFDKAGLKLKPEKCRFHQGEVEFLGHVVGRDGIRVDPAKVAAARDWPTPTNVKEVQSFLGFVNFNRSFVKGYSEHAEPLT